MDLSATGASGVRRKYSVTVSLGDTVIHHRKFWTKRGRDSGVHAARRHLILPIWNEQHILLDMEVA